VGGEAKPEAGGNSGASLQSLYTCRRHSRLLVPWITAATDAKQMEGVTWMEEGGTEVVRRCRNCIRFPWAAINTNGEER
jgi:hypothetical protein